MVFPPGAPDAVTLTTDDVARLAPEEFLNDSLIDFWLKCAPLPRSSSVLVSDDG